METPAITQDPTQPPVVTPAPEKKKFDYQPTYPADFPGVFPEGHELAGQPMAGQPLGGKQVVEYDGTPEDLGRKMAENNTRIQLELRNVKRQLVTARPNDDEEIPKDAQRLSTFNAFEPRELTDEEAIELARSITDPAKVRNALKLMLTAGLGAKPEQFKRLDSVTTRNYFSAQGAEFRRLHPELPWDSAGGELVKSLLGWCKTRDLAYTVENLELAYSRLKKAGLLPEAPIAAEVTSREIAPGTEERPPADSGTPPAEPNKRQVVRTSALTSRNSSPPTAPVNRGGPTWAEVESLSVEQLKAKPEAWRKQAANLFRKLPNDELNKKLKSRTWEQKLNALG